MKILTFRHNFANDSFAENRLHKYFVNSSSWFCSTSFTFAKFIELKTCISLNIFCSMFALKSFTTLLWKVRMIRSRKKLTLNDDCWSCAKKKTRSLKFIILRNWNRKMNKWIRSRKLKLYDKFASHVIYF